MNYKPWELHIITYADVCLAIEGHNDLLKYQHDITRQSTYLICAAGFNGKVAQKFKSLWPVEQKKRRVSEKAMETIREMRRVEALTRQKEIYDRKQTA